MRTTDDTPKYLQLKDFIKSSIQNGELVKGEKIYSENELAKKFNISRHTVRQAIGEMVNEGWLYRSQGRGTFVSSIKGIKKEPSKIIGVITTYLDDYIFPSIIKGIDNVLSKQGYSMILSHTNNKIEREAQCITSMLEKNVDGFIIEPTKSALPNPNLELYMEIKKRDLPLILINGYYPSQDNSYIVEDDEAGGYLAANHLFSLGHEKIGGIFKVDDIQGHNRYKGVVKAHREHGLHIAEESVIWYTTEDLDSLFDEHHGNTVLKRLENCSGIVCYNDQIALMVLELLKKSGKKIPEDMSVVSFDDSELATVSEIKLTTLAHPGGSLGEKAANGLLDLLKFKKHKVKEYIRPELVVRSSTSGINSNK